MDESKDATYSPPVIKAFLPLSLPAGTYSTKPSEPSRAVDSLVGFIDFSELLRCQPCLARLLGREGSPSPWKILGLSFLDGLELSALAAVS